jgi:2-polyprenyl-6-methoxyphenol hydroxylase-like FAD-dependent oxidoreductase
VRVVIVGGGMVGVALARLLRTRGIEHRVLEGRTAGPQPPRPFMLGYHGYPALEDMGLLEPVRAAGWDVEPQGENPIGIALDFNRFVEILREDVDVSYERRLVALQKTDGRVSGVVVDGPDGREEIATDLIVACDGRRSPAREMAGLEAHFSGLGEGGLSFVSPAVIDRPFAMRYTSYGGVVIVIGWPTGSAGWWTIDKIGRDAALAPGLEAFRRSFAALLPPAKPALDGLTSMEQVAYSEPEILTCPRWWTPGLVIIGDAAHFFSPETGVAAGLSLGDAHALAEAIARTPDDADAACAAFTAWREPVVRPFEAADPSREQRIALSENRPRPPEERWPPEG